MTKQSIRNHIDCLSYIPRDLKLSVTQRTRHIFHRTWGRMWLTAELFCETSRAMVAATYPKDTSSRNHYDRLSCIPRVYLWYTGLAVTRGRMRPLLREPPAHLQQESLSLVLLVLDSSRPRHSADARCCASLGTFARRIASPLRIFA